MFELRPKNNPNSSRLKEPTATSVGSQA